MPMRRSLIFLAIFVAGTVGEIRLAARGQEPDPPPPLPKRVREVRILGGAVHTAPNSSTYPRNLLLTLETIENGYVRPVARIELLLAALNGLYEASGESPPTNLKVDTERAIKTNQESDLLEKAKKRAPRLNDEESLLASCRGMLRALDPYCEVLIADEARRGAGLMDNFGTGIDLEEAGGSGGLRIKDVLPGSHAQRSGLRPGDRITKIDEESLARVDAAEANLLLNRGPICEGQTSVLNDVELRLTGRVRLQVERDHHVKKLDITVERGPFHAETVYGVQRFEANHWSFWIDRSSKIAHVRLGALRTETSDDLRDVLTKLQTDGMRGLILDLRECPGGLLDEAVKVAGMFLQKCRVSSAKGRAEGNSADFDNKEPGPFGSLPLMLLVGKDTSGAGELIAAALQDHKRAFVAGQRTRGKASIQMMVALPARRAHLKLTTAIFIRPNGKNLHRFPDSKPRDDWGVRPDDGMDFRVSPAMAQQVREWWVAQTLRPGWSRERLPLDDPENDPQRQLALQALRERLK
jgi:carboxyl-terminal processing protease